jgi:tetratricopeptide (TPR) repeat protein
MRKLLFYLVFGLAVMSGELAAAQDQGAAYYQAANVAYTGKDYDDAMANYQEAIQMDATLWQAYQGLGNCFYAKGQKQSALVDYQKALDLNPNNPQLVAFAQSLREQIGAPPPPPPSQTATPTSAPASASTGHFTWGIGLAVGIPATNGSDETVGFGVNGNVGYAFDENLAILLEIDGLVFPTTFAGFSSIESDVFPAIQYTFTSPGSTVHPFVFGGIGINDNIAEYDYGGGSETFAQAEPLLAIGGGLTFSIANKLDFVLKAKYVEVLTPGASFSFLPLSAGLQFN